MERAVEAIVVLGIFFFGGVSILVLPRVVRPPNVQFHIVEGPAHLDPEKRMLQYLRNNQNPSQSNR